MGIQHNTEESVDFILTSKEYPKGAQVQLTWMLVFNVHVLRSIEANQNKRSSDGDNSIMSSRECFESKTETILSGVLVVVMVPHYSVFLGVPLAHSWQY